MKKIKMITPGMLLCLAVGSPAWLLGRTFPIIGGPVFGILLGMVIAMIFPKLQSKKLLHRSDRSAQTAYRFEDGIKFTAKVLLQYSIILLGFEMNLFNVIKVGSQSMFIMLFTLSTSFVMAFLIGKILKLNSKMTTLICVGTSICGGSAIAATAPVLNAEDKDVAQAISTIFLFNIVAVFIFPALGHLFGMSDIGFGMWAGTAINDTSSVVAAGTAWSAVANNNAALAFATIVKLTRTLMIVPVTLVLAIYTAGKSKKNTEGTTFKFSKVFPWFVIGFVLAAIISTFAGIPAPISHLLVAIGKFIIIMAMVAIGLNTHLKKLLTNGFNPIFLGLCCWFTVAGVSLIVQGIMKIW
ncbi:MAG: YeiH family protein [Bacillota bacterium]